MEADEATVFSCDWTDLPDQIDSPVGHYHVVYSYQVDGTFYTGRFADYGMQDEEYFKGNDVFQVRYNPRKPAQSYYPDLRTRHNFILICLRHWGSRSGCCSDNFVFDRSPSQLGIET